MLLLMLLLVGWLRDFATSTAVLGRSSRRSRSSSTSTTSRRACIDTKHVVYYLSVITFGLFLTSRSVDGERWRG